MPIRYVIEHDRTSALTDEEREALLASGYSESDLEKEYEDVPQTVAEEDENGCYAVFTTNGHKISAWVSTAPHEKLETAWRAGRAKPGPRLRDSIKQEIKHGDYVLMVNRNLKQLELGHIIRNLKTKTELEYLSEGRNWGSDPIIRRDPKTLLKLPVGFIKEGTEVPHQVFTQRFSVQTRVDVIFYRATSTPELWAAEEEYLQSGAVPDVFFNKETNTCLNEWGSYYQFCDGVLDPNIDSEMQHTGWFNEDGFLVTGWLQHEPSGWTGAALHETTHAGKKVFTSLDELPADALGSEISLGDIVLSHDNQSNVFMPAEVVGFTKDRVRLLGYRADRRYPFWGDHSLTINTPESIVKLPITMNINR